VIEKNVNVVTSRGSSCFVCEKATKDHEPVIQVTFNAKVKDPIFGANLGTVSVTEEMHTACAVELHSVLGRKINQAKGGKGHGR